MSEILDEEERKKIFEVRDCIIEGCKNVFEITVGMESFYREKGYPLPKRCPIHRMGNKTQKTVDVSGQVPLNKLGGNNDNK